MPDEKIDRKRPAQAESEPKWNNSDMSTIPSTTVSLPATCRLGPRLGRRASQLDEPEERVRHVLRFH